MINTVIPYSQKGVISSRKEYGNNDQIRAERIFVPTPGFKFDLGTVIVTRLSADGDEGFEKDWDGPQLKILSEIAVKVVGTTRHHTMGTSGHLEFQVTANQIRI
jgi:hypothetical protein